MRRRRNGAFLSSLRRSSRNGWQLTRRRKQITSNQRPLPYREGALFCAGGSARWGRKKYAVILGGPGGRVEGCARNNTLPLSFPGLGPGKSTPLVNAGGEGTVQAERVKQVPYGEPLSGDVGVAIDRPKSTGKSPADSTSGSLERNILLTPAFLIRPSVRTGAPSPRGKAWAVQTVWGNPVSAPKKGLHFGENDTII